MKRIMQHLKTNILKGVLAIIPITLSVLAIHFIYVMVDKRVMEMVQQFIGFRIPGLGVVLVLLTLYIIGIFASNVIGRQLFLIIKRFSNRLPLVKTTYQVGKQLSNTLTLPEKQVFQRVVLIDYFRKGTKVIGFVTGTLIDKNTKKTLLKVFLPTPPNPTSGIVVIVNEKDAVDPGWTIDEALKVVISAGLIGPEVITLER